MISSAKFAIGGLALFAIAMTYGTFVESRYGGEYARIAVYYSWWFCTLEVAIVLSLILSVIARLPFRKNLIGFYVVHASIVITMYGALITNQFGLDGIIELSPGATTDLVRISDEPRLYVDDGGKQTQIELPTTVHEVSLNKSVPLGNNTENDKKLYLLKYLPYAAPERHWVSSPEAANTWIAKWRLKNTRVEQTFELSNLSHGQIPQSLTMGLLTIQVVDPMVLRAYETYLSQAQVHSVLLNLQTGDANAVGDLKKPIKTKDGSLLSQTTNQKLGITTFNLKTSKKDLRFFPRYSQWPVTARFEPDPTAGYAFIDLTSQRSQNTLFLSPQADGSIRWGAGKSTSWNFAPYAATGVHLPWMDFMLTLVEEHRNQLPQVSYISVPPLRPNDNERENLKAVLIAIEAQGVRREFWVESKNVLTLSTEGSLENQKANPHKNAELKLTALIGPHQIHLPFSMTLDHFKIEQVPGTDKPMSYESIVRVSDSTKTHRIYMNNPYKSHGFTFYQSSYFQGDDGQQHSVLAVNKDPGRWIKYAGALLLVVGLILHFLTIYGYIELL